MNWSKEAEQAVSRVPFFIRKRVRKRVEEEAARQGAGQVRLEHVQTCQKRFLDNMEAEVKGHRVEACYGSSGCPNRAAPDGNLLEALENRFARHDFIGFLKEKVEGPLKIHHEFRVSVSECPNACSRPQIADIGIIGARRPEVTDEACLRCGACTAVCPDGAIELTYDADEPQLDRTRCQACGKCLDACPSGTLREAVRGYRFLVGGKLGRHPQLGKEIEGIFPEAEVLDLVDRCIGVYFRRSRAGERFGETLNRCGTQAVSGNE